MEKKGSKKSVVDVAAEQVDKTAADAATKADAAKAVGTSMVLARSMDDALVILHDAEKVGTRQYMSKAIKDATRALMSQDRTVAMRLRRAVKDGERSIPEQPPLTPEIVTLCGSVRFIKELMEVGSKLELEGKIVLGVRAVAQRDAKTHALKIDVPGHDDEKAHKRMVELHKRKIDISDAVIVVNPKLKSKDKFGYIGQSTAEEIVYAHMAKKPIAAIETLPPMEEIVKIAGLTLTKKEAVNE